MKADQARLVQGPRRRRWLRWSARILVSILLVATLVAAWTAWRVWSPLPDLHGRVVVTGIAGPVTILRDTDGIVHIRGANEPDALFALGFAHAQDRLWQMEFQRRVGHGRLAELLGPAALPSDRLFRTVGLQRRAVQILARLSPDARTLLEAYARGVNAWTSRRHGRRLPLEFGILGVEPEPWRPDDTLVWLGVLAWELSVNWRDELLRTRVVARVGEEGAAALMPPRTEGHPAILPEWPALSAPVSGRHSTAERPSAHAALLAGLAATARAARGLYGLAPGIAASNNWVVSGARTSTGKPLLASDPHLGTQMPGLWYLAHVTGGRLDVIGATVPGVPGVLIGHNARIAWGLTNVMTDNQDLFVERVSPRDEALYRDQWEPMQIARETIYVKGGPAETLVVRSTRHGPLVTDLVPGAREALSLAWTWDSPREAAVESWFALNVAGSFDEFTQALSRYRAPMQNVVYADVEGNIGYFAPGAIPIRPTGDGTLPLPGWTGEHDWLGEVPEGEWPRLANPTRGYIASANNPIFPDGHLHVVSTNWEPGYRAARIVEMIEAAPSLTPEAMQDMQADVRSAQVRVVLPWLRRARVQDEASRRALRRLSIWDGSLAPDSAEAAIYKAWTARVAEGLFADELGRELWDDLARPPYWIPKALHHVVFRSDDTWCDDVRTAAREGCEETLGRALAEAVAGLADRQGTAEAGAWRWDRDNVIRFPHVPLHFSAVLRGLFSREVPGGGDAVTVNPAMRSGERFIVASYRQVVDLADLDNSRWMATTGQSGQLFSGHYDEWLEPWRAGRYLPMRFSSEVVDAAVVSRVVLEPRP